MPANECHPIFEPGQRVTCKPSAAVTGKRLAKISGAINTDGTYPIAHADADGKAFGAIAHDAAIGKPVTVLRGSGFIVPLTVAAAVATFEEVKAAAGGKVTPIGVGEEDMAIGYATTAQAVVDADAEIALY